MEAGFGDVRYFFALGAAAVAGLVMGIGPERKGRAAGLRTHMYVAIGAALFTLVALGLAGDRHDPLRVVQGVTLGVGFVGAATVLRQRGHVYGVSTAAQIWLTAALGVEAGAGHPLRSIVLAAAVTLLSTVVRWFERAVLHTKSEETTE